MKHLDLFSGIGGFALAARWAGWRTIGFVEIDPFCQRVLRKHWPGVQIEGDIREVTGRTFPERPDIITGGFPCQDISIGNPNGGGLEGDRSRLWFEMLRIIEEYGPDWAVVENVTNYKRLALDTIIDGLEAAGYEAQPFDIPACAVDLPTMERHVWIVAATNRERSQGSVSATVQRVAAFTRQLPRSDSGDGKRWAIPASRVCGVGERIPHRVERNHALGNAIPPSVAYEIFRAIDQQ